MFLALPRSTTATRRTDIRHARRRLARALLGVLSGGAVLVVAAGAAAQVVPPPTPAPDPCASVSLRLRCPDLVMSAPAHLEMDLSTEPGRVLLRAASSINNHGAGPLELVGRRRGSTMAVSQAIYDADGRRHLFTTRARLVYKYVPGYRYRRAGVDNLSYWKLHDAAAFTLWSVDANLQATGLVRVGPKLDYCLRDLFRTSPSRVSPGARIYGACRTQRSLQRDLLGTSVGWSDVYPYEYPQQWVDVTGLRGVFAYVQTADPLHLLHEADPNNNASETFVELPSGRVLGHRTVIAHP